MPVLLQIPENPNCEPMESQVFQCRTPMRVVTHVSCQRNGAVLLCPVIGIEDGGTTCPATACLVDDSGDGACYLVIGGEWGLRLKAPDDDGAWDLDSAAQWGEPYFLLSPDDQSLRFA